ncbi:MAG: PorV/PorQ family protein [Candidatus Eisenbacteria bacterium]
MRPRPISTILVLPILLLAAHTPSVQGGTGLAFLQAGAGARAASLGKAVVSQVDDPSAPFWNPGALGLLTGTQAELTHSESFRGVRYEAGSVTHRVGAGGLGVAFTGAWADGLERRDETGRDLGTFGYYGLALTTQYARAVTDRVGIGVGVEYLREQIDTSATDGLAFDLGVQARDLVARTDFGAVVLHVGSAMKYERESFDLPLTIQGGLTHHLPWAAARGEVRMSAEVRKVRDEDAQFLFGTEYDYDHAASLDVGYQTAHDTEDVSMGFGVRSGRLRAHYAFVPFGESLGEEHRISFRLLWP